MSVYNGGQELQRTLASIQAQTLSDFELIVVDDGSTDSTASILADAASRDLRIRVIRQENRGITRALIRGCAEARGTYIARHDSGDRSHPQRFMAQIKLLAASHDLVFVSCWTTYVGPLGEPLYEVRGKNTSSIPCAILDPSREWGVIDGPTHHGSVMMRRDAYHRAGGYRQEFAAGQDWDLWYRLGSLGKFQTVPATLYTAQITPGSISSGARAHQQRLARLSLGAMLARQRGEDESLFLRQAAEVHPTRDTSACGEARGLYAIGEALRRRRDVRGRAYLRRATTLCPTLLRAWIRYAQSFF